MLLIWIDSGVYDRLELFEGQFCRQPIVQVRRDVSRYKRSEHHSAREIVLRIDLFGLAQVRITSIGIRRVGMTIVATTLGIDDVAAQANQVAIFPVEM